MRKSTPWRQTLCALAISSLALLACHAKAQLSQAKIEPLEVVTARGVFHFDVEIADSDPARERGLMYRKSLPSDHGMLFDFDMARPVAFWMKNTLIPLDMLFIGADGRVVSIAHDAAPLSETPIDSGGSVRGVLEIAGGRAAQIGAAPGDRVKHRIFPR